jgi:uncharacterized protein
MIKLFKKELRAISDFSLENWRELAVAGFAALFFTLARNNPVGPQWAYSLVYYAIFPIIVTAFLLRRNPIDFGFRPGNWQTWGFHVLITCAVAIPVLYVTSLLPFMAAYYKMANFDLAQYVLEMAAYLFAWEYIFRGFLLFGLKERLGAWSVVVQMIPFVLLHFGKPELEVISTIPVGLYLGYICYRGNSFWPAYIIHLFINVLFSVYVNIL